MIKLNGSVHGTDDAEITAGALLVDGTYIMVIGPLFERVVGELCRTLVLSGGITITVSDSPALQQFIAAYMDR